MSTKSKIYFISLGCDKNRIDAEMMCFKLEEAGYEITSELEEADLALVNTCGFIASSKKEGLHNIFDMVNEKNAGNIRGIIVTGCLSERHGEEMHELIPEVDAIVGIGQNDLCAAVLQFIRSHGLYGGQSAYRHVHGRVNIAVWSVEYSHPCARFAILFY